MSTHGIAGPPNQSSRNSGNKCQLATTLTIPNFVALGQTMYKKSVTKMLPLFSILSPQGDPWAEVHESPH